MPEAWKPRAGAGLAMVLGLAVWGLTIRVLPDSSEGGIRLFATFLVAGMPVGTLLGWRFATRVRRWKPIELMAWMGTAAVIIGDLEVCIVIAVSGMWVGQPAWVLLAPVAFVFGLFYGVFVFPVTFAAAGLWLVAFLGIDRGVEWLHRSCGGALLGESR